MAINVRIRINRAERQVYSWSVEFGANADFTQEASVTLASMDDLPAHLRKVAEAVARDPRVANWPGFRVSADNLGARKPSGWDKRRSDRELYVKIAENAHVAV